MNQYTIEQFGAKIKEKYPQYANYSDADIGKMTLEKHPEYQSRILTNEPTKQNKLLSKYSPESQKIISEKLKSGQAIFQPSETGGQYIGIDQSPLIKQGIENIKSIGREGKGLFGDIGERISNIGDVLSKGIEKAEEGKLITPTEALVGGAKIAYEATAPITDAFTRGFNVLTDIISNNPTLQNIAQTEGVGKLLESVQSGVQEIKDVSKPIVDSVKQWAEENPDLASFAKSTAGTAVNLLGIAGAPEAKTALTQLEKQSGRIASELGTEGKAIVSDVGTLIGKGKEGITTPISGLVEKSKETASQLFGQKIPPQVETSLKNVSSKTFDTYSKIAQDASKSYKNPTPLEYAGTRAQEALDTIQRKLSNIGETKSQVLERNVVGNKPVGNIVVKFRQELKNALADKTALEGDSKLLNSLMNKAKQLGNNPTASQVDKFIDTVQDLIFTSKKNLTVPITDSTTAQLRTITRNLNESLKSQLPESYRNLNSKYSDLIDTRNELNLKLGAEGEKGGSLMKRVFSPSDANTKKLFADVKDITGIDLIDEATIARYVMEVTGDARQASMLQQLQLPNLSSKGMLDFVKDLVTKRFNTPEEILRRARELTAESQLREATLNKKTHNISQPMAITNPTGGQTKNIITQSKNAIDTSKQQFIPKSKTVQGITDYIKDPKMGLSVKNTGQSNINAFIKTKPEYGLLKDMETFIDIKRLKTDPPYKNFVPDLIEQFERRGIQLPNTEAGLAKFFEDILTQLEYPYSK